MRAVIFLGFAIAFLVVSTSDVIRTNYLMPENGDRSVDHSKPDLKFMFKRMSIDTAAGKQWLMVINQKCWFFQIRKFLIKLKHAKNSGRSESEFNYDVTGVIDDVRVSPTKYRIHSFTSTVSDDGKYLNMTMVVGIDKVLVQHNLKASGIWQTYEFEPFELSNVLSVFGNVKLSCSVINTELVRVFENGKMLSVMDMPYDRPNCRLIDVDPSSISIKYKGQKIIVKHTNKCRSPELAPSKSDLENMIRVLRPQFKSLIEEYMGDIFIIAFDGKTYEILTEHGPTKNFHAQRMEESSS